jgi:hypothetical protein
LAFADTTDGVVNCSDSDRPNSEDDENMPEYEVSPEIERLIGRLEVCGWKRPNWGWGSRDPVPMFTEVEIRAACATAKRLDQETDDIIDALKLTRAHHIVEITA